MVVQARDAKIREMGAEVMGKGRDTGGVEELESAGCAHQDQKIRKKEDFRMAPKF